LNYSEENTIVSAPHLLQRDTLENAHNPHRYAKAIPQHICSLYLLLSSIIPC